MVKLHIFTDYTLHSNIYSFVAHTAQFIKPGWKYLMHNSGVGLLKHGGSYVSLMSWDRNNLTIIIETIVSLPFEKKNDR